MCHHISDAVYKTLRSQCGDYEDCRFPIKDAMYSGITFRGKFTSCICPENGINYFLRNASKCALYCTQLHPKMYSMLGKLLWDMHYLCRNATVGEPHRNLILQPTVKFLHSSDARVITLRRTYKSMSYERLNEQEYKYRDKRYTYPLNVFPCVYMSFFVGNIWNRFTQIASHIHQPTYFADFTPVVCKIMWKVGRIW